MSSKSFNRSILKFIIPLFVATTFVFVNQKERVETSAWSGNQTSNAGEYYSSVGSETGETLRSKLKTIISNPKPSTSYDWPRYEAADEAEGVSDSVLLIYSRKVVKKTAHVSSGKGWNREHSFPKSKLGGTGAASDNHHIFADDNRTNSIRSNNKFGVVPETAGNQVKDGYGDLTNSYTANSLFMPTPEARGEVARATMYLNTMYNLDITNNFTSIALMLEWHLEHPITNRDIYRNNTVYGLQKNRNPYVDHPEYACAVWGNTNSATQNICATSGSAEVTSVSLTPKNQTISLQGSTSLQLNATVLPHNAANKALNWTSSNTSVATISTSGTLLAKGVGTTTVTATSVENSALKDTATITVTNDPISVTGISISDKNVSVGVNKKVILNTEILPSNATNKSVVWQSSNPLIASVTSEGEVKGLQLGTSTITVKTVDGNKTASVLVTVANAPALSAVIGDCRNGAANDKGSGFEANDLNNGDPGTGNENYLGFGGTEVVKSVSSSQGYLPRSGGLAIGSGSNSGNVKITLNEKYATKKIDVLFKDAGKTVSITMKGSPEAGTVVSGTIEKGSTTGVPYSLSFSQPQTVFDISATFRVAIIEIVIYLEVEAEEENPLEEATLWATEFLELTAEGCATSNEEELYSAWQLAEDSFNDLSEDAKDIIIYSAPIYSTTDDLAHARARYEVIKDNYAFYDFLVGEDESSNVLTENKNTNSVAFVVFFALLALSASGLFMIKSKKKN